jgi:hypothetical protein
MGNQIGITTGIGNDQFDPEGLISREQMAVMTVRFFEAMGIPLPEPQREGFPVIGMTLKNMPKTQSKNYGKQGCARDENGQINPQQQANRAEAATLSAQTDQSVKMVCGKRS